MTNKNLATSTAPRSSSASVFAGADVCELAGLALTPGALRPIFDQDVWVLDGLADAHRLMGAAEKRWDFTVIANLAWRRTAKELMLALLAPAHEAVARLPHAHRNRLSPRTCRKHLHSLIKWLSWLEEHHVRSLSEVTQIHCDQFLQDAFVKHDPNGNRTENANTPGSVAARVWVLQLVAIYGELFSTDRYRPGFVPWNGTPANTVAGHQRAGENRTPPVPLPVLQPLLAACLYLVTTIGPHLVQLRDEFRQATEWGSAPPGLLSDTAVARLTSFLAGQIEAGRALQRLPQAAIDRPTRSCRSTSTCWADMSATANCCCVTPTRSDRNSNTPWKRWVSSMPGAATRRRWSALTAANPAPGPCRCPTRRSVACSPQSAPPA